MVVSPILEQLFPILLFWSFSCFHNHSFILFNQNEFYFLEMFRDILDVLSFFEKRNVKIQVLSVVHAAEPELVSHRYESW